MMAPRGGVSIAPGPPLMEACFSRLPAYISVFSTLCTEAHHGVQLIATMLLFNDDTSSAVSLNFSAPLLS